MANHSDSKPLPSWLMLVIFLGILTVLWVFGDLFTLILGIGIMAIIFSGGYDRSHAHDEDHH